MIEIREHRTAICGDVLFDVLPDPSSHGYQQREGVVRARARATLGELWTRAVYRPLRIVSGVRRDGGVRPDLETPIGELRVDARRQLLVVVDVRGNAFEMALDGRSNARRLAPARPPEHDDVDGTSCDASESESLRERVRG